MLDLNSKKPEFDKAIEYFKSELAKLRTGRANTAMIEEIKADYYGQPVAINTIASITIPEPKQLVIAPWDKNALAAIEKAVRDSGLGFNPVNEGDKIRINIPPLTEERRRDLTKVAGKLAEEVRVRIRKAREDIWEKIQQQEKAGKLPEDEKFRLKDKLQELVDEYNKQIKELAEKKESEIMTI